MENTDKKLQKQAYIAALQIFGVFGGGAILGLFLGTFLDNTLLPAPFGTLLSLVACYILGWAGVFMINKRLRKNVADIKDESTE